MFVRLLIWVLLSFLVLMPQGRAISAGEQEPQSSERAVSHPPSGLSPQQTLDNLVVGPDVRIRLVASEPQIIDPVAVRFDWQGRMWVVEMRDYPSLPAADAVPRGRIRILEDRDGNGFFETATTFADELMFPTGVQPWKNGAIVTVAGAIIFLADESGNGVADRRETWFTGFAEQNEQLRANHPTLAADGRVYVAGGLRGGMIVSQNDRWSRDQPLPLQGFDFAFDPNGGYFGAVTGNSQYGITIDDFGKRIGCSNRNPGIEAVLPTWFVQQSKLPPRDALHDMARAGADSEVQAIATAWTTSNLHGGQFTAACGVLRGAGGGLPDDWSGDLFVCEPTAYAVQRQTVQRQGPLLRADRVAGPECVASRDDWFRPVALAGGPDGCLYIVDMSRAVIEHPDWMPTELKERRDLRWGDQQGRIWRLSAHDQPDGGRNEEFPVEQPWQWWFHPNPWQRETASLKLYQHPPSAALLAEVQEIVSGLSERPEPEKIPGLARAIQWLNYHDHFSEAMAQRLLKVDDAPLRMLTLALIRKRICEADLVALGDDPDPAVRFEVAMQLIAAKRNSPAAIATLGSILLRDADSPWIAKIFSAVDSQQAAGLIPIVAQRPVDQVSVPIRRQLAALVPPDQLPGVVTELPRDLQAAEQLAFLVGWCNAVRTAGTKPAAVTGKLPDSGRQWIQHAFQQATEVASDGQQATWLRLLALEAVAAEMDDHLALRPLVAATQPEAIRRAVLPLLIRKDLSWSLNWLDEQMPQLPAKVREAAVNALLTQTKGAQWLLDQLEEGRLRPALIGLSAMERLKRSSNVEIRKRALEVLAAVAQDRQSLIEKYQPALVGNQDPGKGHVLFRQHCAACHRIGEIGIDVGPDISDSRTKSPESLLVAILDPNAAIDAAYLRYTVLTLDGEVFDGLLLADYGTEVLLQLQGGERRTINREDVESISTAGISFMPEGFEQLLNVDQMRDLIGFLKNWRYLDGSIPLGAASGAEKR